VKTKHNTDPPPAERLLGRREVTAIVGVSHVTLWTWQRAGTFPRSRIVGGQSMWLSSEIDVWLAKLQVRPLKGDPGVVSKPRRRRPVDTASVGAGG
jgi:predicted DNA-binding transcriptional regulator AlpA